MKIWLDWMFSVHQLVTGMFSVNQLIIVFYSPIGNCFLLTNWIAALTNWQLGRAGARVSKVQRGGGKCLQQKCWLRSDNLKTLRSDNMATLANLSEKKIIY